MTQSNLYTINKPPSHRALYDEMLASVDANTGTLLLIEDASYLVQENEQHASLTSELMRNFKKVSVLDADIRARGLKPNPSISVITYADFVELSVNTSKTVAWF